MLQGIIINIRNNNNNDMYDRSEYFDMHDNPMNNLLHGKRVIKFNLRVLYVVRKYV